ncbi:MAG: hypothetical protein U9R36_04235 [Elusimicrobiota bacterium]|nr:hypothetical protein [Elusimicrobiota bacterium]
MKAEKKKTAETFEEINETFVLKDIKTLDNRNRINIGSELVEKLIGSFSEVDSFKIFLGEEGDILLRPAANIPSREL